MARSPKGWTLGVGEGTGEFWRSLMALKSPLSYHLPSTKETREERPGERENVENARKVLLWGTCETERKTEKT